MRFTPENQTTQDVENIHLMMKEAQNIAEDISAYFYYHQSRQPLMQKLLDGTSNN